VTFQATGRDPLVTLIVPTKDKVELLRRCVDGMLHRTDYRAIEILIVDNNSEQAETLEYLDDIQKEPSVRVVQFAKPFNFARICNFAAEQARGEILGFVNNDVEVISGDWLDEMVMLAQRPEVGCVGAKLLYADDTIQHAGVILGLGGYAAHSHRCSPRDSGGYFNRLKVRQNVSAVTGACLVVRTEVYRQAAGMDERLAVAYNDVDFCLKVTDAGYLNVFTPFAQLYHFESKTRGYEDTDEKQARFQREKDYLKRKWGDRIRLDPFYNPNLTHSREDFSIGS
jgi:GT2 family glycosyltransferase